MFNVDKYVEDVIMRETGGTQDYVNDPDDAGGETRWGITKATAREYGYMGDMRQLPKETAINIYKSRYWLRPGYDKLVTVDSKLAETSFDFGVLVGEKVSSRMVQRALNVLNNKGQYYPDIIADGIIGNKTIAAYNGYKNIRGKEGIQLLHNVICGFRSTYLVEVAERKEINEKYVFGWLSNRVHWNE